MSSWPIQQWCDAPGWHPAVGRAMQMDREQTGGAYALYPFRLSRVDDAAVILAAYPAPHMMDEDEAARIDLVAAWDPIRDSAYVLGDPQDQLFGALHDDAAQIYRSPRAFFQAWAQQRAQFSVRFAEYARVHGIAEEMDCVPGALTIGAIDKIRWTPALLPNAIECVGVDPKALNSAILRAAKLPRVFAQSMRAAA